MSYLDFLTPLSYNKGNKLYYNWFNSQILIQFLDFKQLNNLNNKTIKIGNAKIKPSYNVKNFGVEFDVTLLFKNHVNNTYTNSVRFKTLETILHQTQ